jgi:hypothetical protein
MTCAACSCNSCKRKKAAPVIHIDAPRRSWHTRYLSELILVVACALSALVAIKFVAPVTVIQGNELELRVEQLEKHSILVDATYHKGLK